MSTFTLFRSKKATKGSPQPCRGSTAFAAVESPTTYIVGSFDVSRFEASSPRLAATDVSNTWKSAIEKKPLKKMEKRINFFIKAER
ncbi:MAG: hypothetical protein U1D69_10505 [Polynucleobacter sp.]|nr:hypothetical protein [Polynucleobacter sp.]